MINVKISKRIKSGLLLPLILLFSFAAVSAQTPEVLTLEECYTLSRETYPLIRQKELIAKSREYSVENVRKGYLPQLSVNGQATYQSAVTQLPIKLPNVHIEQLSKDQYKLYAEATQLLYDGGITRQQQHLQEASAVIEDQKVEVELYKLKERINQLYFGILLMDEQLNQTALVRKDIENGIKRTEAAISNGTAFHSAADVLSAELLKLNQRVIELKANRTAYLTMLGLFINKTLPENIRLAMPPHRTLSTEMQRPELMLFDYQKRIFDINSRMVSAKNLPKAGLFLQAGYGRPALNFLNNAFTGYYIGGIRFSWVLSGVYTSHREKQLLELNKSTLNLQREIFLFNTGMVSTQQNAEITKLRELTTTDEQLIALREKIKNTARAQLENGVITTNDYLREVNAEDQARQNLLLHQLQLLLAEYNYATTQGN